MDLLLLIGVGYATIILKNRKHQLNIQAMNENKVTQ